MRQSWDERYSTEAYAYGEEPNVYFREILAELPAGKLLLPAEGEGRNAVHAARQGWAVEAFDQSAAGKSKALQLAEKHGVSISYQVGDALEMAYPAETFDAIALIYAHFPADIRAAVHRHLLPSLKVGGVVILEAFSKRHIPLRQANPAVGGPTDIAMLFSEEEIRQEFPAMDIIALTETEIELNEGAYHIGRGSVIRFVGRKLR